MFTNLKLYEFLVQQIWDKWVANVAEQVAEIQSST